MKIFKTSRDFVNKTQIIFSALMFIPLLVFAISYLLHQHRGSESIFIISNTAQIIIISASFTICLFACIYSSLAKRKMRKEGGTTLQKMNKLWKICLTVYALFFISTIGLSLAYALTNKNEYGAAYVPLLILTASYSPTIYNFIRSIRPKDEEESEILKNELPIPIKG